LKHIVLALLPLGIAAAAVAQGVSIPNPPPSVTGPMMPPRSAAPAVKPAAPAAKPAAPAAQALPGDIAAAAPPLPPKGGTQLMLRGLDKITGRPTNITAPIGKPVRFATLTITARFCYSTPQNETPETTAFVQIEDHRQDQPSRRVFSGWMYGSSPGLNGVEHPLYDVWVINCNNAPPPAVAANTAATPSKVKAPDSSDKEELQALPEGAGQ
jgi:hypothetical protein